MTVSKSKFENCFNLYRYLLKIETPIIYRAFKTKDNTYYIYFYDENNKQYASFTLNDDCAIWVIDYYLKECQLPCIKEIAFNV